MDDEDGDFVEQEIYEWYRVDGFLYKILRDKGKPVIDAGYDFYWGRTCTGQAVHIDYIFEQICRELEMLEGQKHYRA